jgi:hypothetical protein
MYGRNGGVDVAESDAITTCNKFPHEWTLKPWIRPNGRPDVFIEPDWQQLPGPALIRLALTTFPNEGRGTASIDNGMQAFDAIAGYLAGTVHPGHP